MICRFPPFVPAAFALCLAACHGGNNYGPGDSTSPGAGTQPPSASGSTSFSVGGIVSGLAAGTQLTLLDNGADSTAVSANGTFTFATQLASGDSFGITIGTQPTGEFCAVTNGSGVVTANVTNVSIDCGIPQYVVSTFAGSTTAGSADGTGTSASFSFPFGVAVDSSGNVYVGDTSNQEIRKITAQGDVTTLAGSTTPGAADGTGAAASFNDPEGVATDAAGNVYVVDHANNEIRKVSPAGVVTTLAGSTTPGSTDAVGTAASFNLPTGIAIDANGYLYVADSSNNEIRKIAPDGTVSTLAGSTTPGSRDGVGAAASFNMPTSVAVDASGVVYVVDHDNQEIRKISPSGSVSTLAGSTTAGHADGTGAAASFDFPYSLALDQSGSLYVADYLNNEIRLVTSAGVVTTIAGSTAFGHADGTGTAATFFSPVGIAVDAGGNLFVAEIHNNDVRKITLTP
jgi:serine/threonine protein kinase, bacterial